MNHSNCTLSQININPDLCLHSSRSNIRRMKQPKPNRVPDTPCPRCEGRLFKGQIGLNAHIRIMHGSSASQPLPTTTPQRPLSLTEMILKLRKSSRVFSRVPQGVRILVATEVAHLMQECVRLNTEASWSRLMTFTYHVLASSGKSSDSQCSKIRANLKS